MRSKGDYGNCLHKKGNAMKKFFLRCLLFVLPLLALLVALEYMVRQVPNPYKFKYEWMQKNAEDIETLVFGSSHTFYGIRPEFLDGKAFSLANVSQNWTQDLFLLKYWSDRYKNLKTIICPVSYFSFTGRGMEYGSESYRCRYYRIYMDCNLYNSLKDRFEFSNFKTAMAKIGKILHKGSNDFDNFGWGTAYELSKKDMAAWNNGSEADAAVKRHTAKSFDYVEKNYKCLKEIAEFCKSHNIKLVLVTTPCWHTYYDNLGQEQLSKVYELTQKITDEYGYQYFNYLKDNRFVAEDFYDSNHLSDVGAEKFTKMLRKIVEKK